eukprot:8012643-Pyramimonas_sp.AAC.1
MYRYWTPRSPSLSGAFLLPGSIAYPSRLVLAGRAETQSTLNAFLRHAPTRAPAASMRPS